MRAHGWTKDRPNILVPEYLEKIEAACEKAPIFGLHSWYYGGCSASTFAFTRLQDFLDDVDAARPGDKYEIWSANDLEEKQQALIHRISDGTGSVVISNDDLSIFRNYLRKKGNEFFAIFLSPDMHHPETKLNDSDYAPEELLEDSISWCSQPGSEIYVFPFTDIDKPEHILVEAKKPNENGEVPIGGAY